MRLDVLRETLRYFHVTLRKLTIFRQSNLLLSLLGLLFSKVLMIIIWKEQKENCSSTSMVTVSVILLLELHINRCLYCKQSYLLSAAKSHQALPSCHDVLLVKPF